MDLGTDPFRSGLDRGNRNLRKRRSFMDAMAPWRARSFSRILPRGDMENLHERLERMFRASYPELGAEQPMEWLPAVDLKEDDSEFMLTGEFPGLTENDVTVEIERNVLTLKGEKKSEREEKKEKNGRWHLIERSYGSFQRSFTLPATVDAAKIDAKFENGVLVVHMPKRKESSARQVPIAGKKT
jgi:HSP20 family protein